MAQPDGMKQETEVGENNDKEQRLKSEEVGKFCCLEAECGQGAFHTTVAA